MKRLYIIVQVKPKGKSLQKDKINIHIYITNKNKLFINNAKLSANF